MSRWTALLLLPASLTLACAGADKGGGEDSGSAGDAASDGADGTIDYEEGCILVDGEGGYAWINDAIAVAEPGATIELCASTGHEEAVLVDKAVHIVGPGSDAFMLTAPTNSPGVTITAADASLTGVSVQTDRTAVVITEASGVHISDLSVLEAGNWAVKATESDDLTLSGLNLLGNGSAGIQYGGVSIQGGSAELSDSTLQGNVGYGLWAEDGAQVSVSSSQIDSTSEYDPTDDTTDGVGLYSSDGAAISSVANGFIGNALAAAWTDAGDLLMDGDTIFGGAVGAYVSEGEADFSDVTIEDVTSVGIIAATTQAVRIFNTTVTTTPEGSVHVAYDSYPSASIAGSGVLISALDIEIESLSVSGFQNAGLFLEAREAGATATATDVTLSDNGNYGVFANNGIVATFNNLVIDGTRVVDEQADRLVDLDGDGVPETDTLCYYVNYFAAFYNSASTITWNGGSLTGSQGWGVSNLQGSLDATGVAFEGAACAGTVSLRSVLSVADSTFTNRGDSSHIISQDDSAVVLERNTFTANQATGTYTRVDDYLATYGYRYTYVYEEGYAVANDALIYGAANADIRDNLFEDGDSGLVLAGVSGTIADNTWSNYRNSAMQISSYTTADGSTDRGDLTIENTTLSGVNGRMLYCSSANLELEDVTIEQGAAYPYSYQATIEFDDDGDGEVDSSYDFSSSSTSSNIGLYAYSCDLLMSDVTFQDLEGNGIELYASSAASSLDAIGLTIQRTGTDTVYSDAGLRAYASQGSISLNLSDVVIDDVDALPGMSIYTASTGTIDLLAENLSITNAGGDGLYLRGPGASADITNLVVSDVDDNGVESDGGVLVLAGTSVTNAGDNGIVALGDFDNDGYSVAEGDCHDNNSSINPGRAETLGNLIDDDCDGTADDGASTTDNDGDGYTLADGDCNDSSSGAAIYPGAADTAGNGVDDDCDGTADGGLDPLASVTGLTITGAGDSGVDLEDRTVVFDGNTVTGNADWGLECVNAVFTSCDTNTLSSNGLGNNDGCATECGL